MSDLEVGRKVLGPRFQSLEQALIQSMLWLEHVLRTSTRRWLHCAGSGWRMVQNGHSMAWVKSVKALISNHARVVAGRLPDWDP